MARATTSIHGLNGDRPLGSIGKAGYFLLNWLNNQLPHRAVDRRLSVRDFACADWRERWPQLARGASPSRKMSDLFWMALPWSSLAEVLGDIHVLDIGCGSGRYGERLSRWSGNRIASYTGLDARAHPQWSVLERHHPGLRFIEASAAEVGRVIPDAINVCISQSAIEHIDEDVRLFEQLRDFAERDRRKFLQVHLCPSAACLKLYLLHGIRQYTPRTISRITRLYGDDYRMSVFRLGGNACNRLHYDCITKPLRRVGMDVRQANPDEYERRARNALEADFEWPSRAAAFYALVIHARLELTPGTCL